MPRKDRPINPFDEDDTPPLSKGNGPRRMNSPVLQPMTRAERERIESRRQPSKRYKKRSDIAGTATLTREPALTATLAAQYVKMLHAGLSPIIALQYFAPLHYDTLDRQGRLAWLSRWERDPLMARASASYMKGEWHDIDKDTRLEIALDKHMAELAYLLYSSDYTTADGTELKKLDTARDAIMQWVSQGDETADTPYVRALKDLLEGKLEGMSAGPPQIGTSIPIEKVPSKKES